MTILIALVVVILAVIAITLLNFTEGGRNFLTGSAAVLIVDAVIIGFLLALVSHPTPTLGILMIGIPTVIGLWQAKQANEREYRLKHPTYEDLMRIYDEEQERRANLREHAIDGDYFESPKSG